jgi:shikimate kinase
VLAFVIGPSGVGKSTLLRGLAFEVFDMDDVDRASGEQEWGIGWEERRWERDANRLAVLATTVESRGVVVDVGAGSLATAAGRSYFGARSANTVAVMAPSQAVFYRRLARPHKTEEEFRATEYSPERRALYQAARFTVDASKREEEAAAELDRCLALILQLRRIGWE